MDFLKSCLKEYWQFQLYHLFFAKTVNREASSLRSFTVCTYLHTYTYKFLTLKRPGGGGGLNQDEGSSSARHDLGDEARVVKPSCNYHHWCLYLVCFISNYLFGRPVDTFWHFYGRCLEVAYFFIQNFYRWCLGKDRLQSSNSWSVLI